MEEESRKFKEDEMSRPDLGPMTEKRSTLNRNKRNIVGPLDTESDVSWRVFNNPNHNRAQVVAQYSSLEQLNPQIDAIEEVKKPKKKKKVKNPKVF